MDEQIEKIISLAGNKNHYQYFTLIVIVFLWINCNFIAIVLPFIEREPIINYQDKEGYHSKETLTNEICDKIEDYYGDYNYTVVESFNYSWVIEYHIECNKFDVGLIGSFAFIGNTAGGLVFSVINKIFSHKKILIISSFGFCLAVFLCTIVRDYKYFLYLLFSETFIGLFGNCLCYSSLVIVQEIVSNDKRSTFSSIINLGYSLCGILYSLAFLYLQEWRKVFFVLIGGSGIALILIWIFIYDSPRGYINSKNYKKTMEILEGIASFNGKLDEFRESIKLDEYQDILNAIKGEEPIKITGGEKNEENMKEEKEIGNINDSKIPDIATSLISTEKGEEAKKQSDDSNKENQGNKKKDKTINIYSLFKYPSIRYKFLILNILWIGTRAAFNGISISSKSFPGNFYLNIIVLYIIESVSYCVSGVLIDIQKIGRKGALWIQYFIIIVVLLILAFVELDTIPALILNYISRFCAAGIEVIYYTYSLEVYPTPVRSIAFGVNATFGNGGSILAPLLLEFLPNGLFLTVFAIVCGLNSFLISFLPETVGKPMVESIKELEE